MIDRAAILKKAAGLIDSGALDSAGALIATEYPFRPGALLNDAVRETGLNIPVGRSRPQSGSIQGRRRRKLLLRDQHALFVRDGYRCAYSGIRLVSPPALLLLSELLPMQFPCANYPRCPLNGTHIAIWLLFPSPEHIEAFASGGDCTENNLVTASNAVNSVKSNHTLIDLGWPTPIRGGGLDDWDGLIGWFRRIATTRPDIIVNSRYASFFGSWYTVVSL